MGSEAKFLEYNKDNIFINTIQAEGHFKKLESGAASRGEFLSCISKHLADVEGEAGEAISHSLIVEGVERSRGYAEISNEARKLRKLVQSGSITTEEGIRSIRALRHRFESMNPLFDTSKCRSCGSAEDYLEELKNLDGERGLQNLERSMALHVLREVSAKYGVEPPKLMVSDTCHEPNEGYITNDGVIHMCQGGINLHVLLHEFKHYHDLLTGKSVNEDDAEAFAVEIVEKGLYVPTTKHNHSDEKKMSKAKDVGLVIGGVNLGWGIGYAAKAYIDPMAPGVVLGQDPSLLIDVGGTIGGIAVALWKKRSDMVRKLAAYVAAGLSTHLWEDLEKVLTPIAPAAGVVGEAVSQQVLGVQAVGESFASIPSGPTVARRLAGYPFPAPVSVGQTMSPPHHTLNGYTGLRTVSLGPKYTLDTF